MEQVSLTEITDEEFVCAKGGHLQRVLTPPTSWYGAAQRIAACYLAICAAMLLVSHHVREGLSDLQLSGPPEESALRDPPDRLYDLLEQLLFVIPALDGETPSDHFWEELGRSDQVMTGEE